MYIRRVAWSLTAYADVADDLLCISARINSALCNIPGIWM